MVKMITGDHKETASVISRELGLKDRVVTGLNWIRWMLTSWLESSRMSIYSHGWRLSRRSRSYSTQGKRPYRGNDGDGVNDAPALKQAISASRWRRRHRGCQKSRRDVLTDDNFATIVGRFGKAARSTRYSDLSVSSFRLPWAP